MSSRIFLWYYKKMLVVLTVEFLKEKSVVDFRLQFWPLVNLWNYISIYFYDIYHLNVRNSIWVTDCHFSEMSKAMAIIGDVVLLRGFNRLIFTQITHLPDPKIRRSCVTWDQFSHVLNLIKSTQVSFLHDFGAFFRSNKKHLSAKTGFQIGTSILVTTNHT